MIGSLVRSLCAIVVGLATAFAFVIGVEIASSIVHPFPPGVDPTDFEACKAHVARYPAWVLMLVVVAWGLTTFASAWLATRLGTGTHPAHGVVVGLILLAMVVLNMSMLPYPIWFWVANLAFFPLAFLLGAKLGRAKALT